jgi:hypothetical protein
MMYTRERLMKAVRDAGRGGRQFTLGEVRAELGIKSRDKREQKRFRSGFRECSQIFGDKLEKIGPNTFRLTAGFAPALPGKRADETVQTLLPLKSTRAAIEAPAPKSESDDAPVSLLDRVGAPANDDEWKRRPREQISFDKAPVHDKRDARARGHEGAAEATRQLSFSERISTWFGRPARAPQSTNGASIALSRLAVELQPKAAGFEYRWIDGKLEVQRANK